jgi:hypothetical protein
MSSPMLSRTLRNKIIPESNNIVISVGSCHTDYDTSRDFKVQLQLGFVEDQQNQLGYFPIYQIIQLKGCATTSPT